MTEEQERAAFKDWYESQPNGYSDPWEGWKARAALSQPASPTPEAMADAFAAEGITPYPNNPGRWLSEHRPGLNYPSALAAYKDKISSHPNPASPAAAPDEGHI